VRTPSDSRRAALTSLQRIRSPAPQIGERVEIAGDGAEKTPFSRSAMCYSLIEGSQKAKNSDFPDLAPIWRLLPATEPLNADFWSHDAETRP